MSVYSTGLSFNADDHDASCGRWLPVRAGHTGPGRSGAAPGRGTAPGRTPSHTNFRYDESRPCTCLAGPVVYQDGNSVPAADDPRAGLFDLSEIRSDDHVRPYMRASIADASGRATVVLTADQVRRIHEYTGRWLERLPDEPKENVGGTS